MSDSKNNELILKFLSDNKTYWSYADLEECFLNHFKGLKQQTLYNLRYQISIGNITNWQISKYQKPILDLCKIVKKKLDDEKEILESITEHQTVN